jgi:hypothetical protein
MRRYRRPDYRNGSKPTNVVDITSVPKFLEVDGRSRDNLIDRWRSLVFAPLSPAGFGLALVSRPVLFFRLFLFETGIVGRDTFSPLPSFCNSYDVTVPILIRMFMSKFEAQRRLSPNAFLLFLATCVGFKRCPDVPFVE